MTTIWLTHVLSEADHRMNRVQPWAERRLETLRGCSDIMVQACDLADVLRRFRLRRLWRVNSEAHMIAAGQNLKRLLKKTGLGTASIPGRSRFWLLFEGMEDRSLAAR